MVLQYVVCILRPAFQLEPFKLIFMILHVVDLQTWPNSSLRLDVRAIAGVSVSS